MRQPESAGAEAPSKDEEDLEMRRAEEGGSLFKLRGDWAREEVRARDPWNALDDDDDDDDDNPVKEGGGKRLPKSLSGFFNLE